MVCAIKHFSSSLKIFPGHLASFLKVEGQYLNIQKIFRQEKKKKTPFNHIEIILLFLFFVIYFFLGGGGHNHFKICLVLNFKFFLDHCSKKEGSTPPCIIATYLSPHLFLFFMGVTKCYFITLLMMFFFQLTDCRWQIFNLKKRISYEALFKWRAFVWWNNFTFLVNDNWKLLVR